MIDEYCEPPVAVSKWIELYNNIDWEFAFSLAFKTLKTQKIQTLQYKILTNIFPCNSKYTDGKFLHHQGAICVMKLTQLNIIFVNVML